MSKLRSLLILLSVGCFIVQGALATGATTETVAADSEVALGTLLSASEDIPPYGETFRWPDGLISDLTDASVDDVLTLQGFPVAPGERLAVRLQRFELYAEDSTLYVVRDGVSTPSPRSQRRFFRGRSVDEPKLAVALSLDANSRQARGLLLGPDGQNYEILPSSEVMGQHLLRHVRRAAEEAGTSLQAHCDADILAGGTTVGTVPSELRLPRTSDLGVALLTAVVAVDTDNEFNHLKFGNDTTAATDYIADLFNEMNTMYERDVNLRLLIGDTFLRLDLDSSPTYNDDPYDNTDSPASSAALNEFGNFWQSNMSSVDRVFAMLLSGKSSSSNSASGIAWVDGYCESQNTGGGYSVNQIFRGNFPIINDARLVGHELGHNHGSPHTHCYSPPIDECSNIGSGCYDGSNGFNCPSGGPGTVMSYCNFSASGCGPNRLEFHPVVIANIDLLIAAHTFAGCIEPLVDPGEVFTDGFASGGTANWDDTVP